jgi:hypothetical protein
MTSEATKVVARINPSRRAIISFLPQASDVKSLSQRDTILMQMLSSPVYNNFQPWASQL